MNVAIVDLGVSNIGSLRNLLDRLGMPHYVAREPSSLESASHLIMPGVGAFDTGMGALQASGLVASLTTHVLRRRVPILGICLGMQLFGRRSEEGRLPGLGWLEADCVRLPDQSAMVPHIGWNTVEVERPNTLIPKDAMRTKFYFAHSYHLVCDDPQVVIGRTLHGTRFASVIRRDNIIGAQFHPEKSHRYGQEFVRSFLHVTPS